MKLGPEFAGRVALLTGAAGGIGRELAKRLDDAGLRLVLCDLNQDGLAELAAELKQEPLLIAGDLCQRSLLEHIRQTVEEKFGRLDILLNNAAVVRTDRFDEYTLDHIESDLHINLITPLLLSRIMVPLLKQAPDPRIINTISLGGVLPMPESPLYSASKFGLRGATLSIAVDFEKKGIKVGGILPSSVDTAQLRHEALTGGSALNFIDPPQSPSHVADEMLRMLLEPRYERYPKVSDAMLVRLAMLFPNKIGKIINWFEKKGQAGRKRYLEERGLTSQVVRW
jgi:short-subunit dehydrogenase